jgi:predicted MFS family arabinose efflux permease
MSATRFALFGAALIAISYGLARFAFGLFVPQIRNELDLSSFAIGIIGALPLISFVAATIIAPFSADRFGARATAVMSGVFGVAGLALISRATGAISLGAGVFACGVCTGLMMPALTAAMQALVKRTVHGRVSSVLNAGTSIGVIVAVPAVVFLAGAWRLAYGSFAALAAVGLVAAWLLLPSVSPVVPANAALPEPISAAQWSRLFRLSVFAFVMGFVSAAYWLFAPDLAVTLGSLSPGLSGLLWVGVGLAGLGGAIVADLADRNNPPITHALMLMMMSASLTLLAASPGQLALAAFSALVFGMAYMSLTGLYLMTGIRLLSGRMSMGPVLPFIAVALGQAAGSPVAGALVGALGYADAFSAFAVVGIVVSVMSPLYPRYIDQEPEPEPELETGLQAAYDYQLVDDEGEPFSYTAAAAEVESEAELDAESQSGGQGKGEARSP